MAAIIKKNFRLQNARDFLENLKAHPRVTDGIASPLEESDDLIVAAVEDGATSTQATLTWTWTVSNTVSDTNAASPELRADAIKGLRDQVGSHLVDRNHYLFIGKSTPWTDTTGDTLLAPSTELAPAPALDTLEEERRVWDEMLGLKKITELTTSLVVPRHDWDGTGKTVYRVYDDKNPNLHNTPNADEIAIANVPRGIENLRLGSFYVINSEYDLFVCIETGRDSTGDPTPSTEEPRRTQSPTEVIDYTAIDGYVWKYITTIRSADIARFTTDSWIPVKTLNAQELKESELEEDAGGLPNPQALVQQNAVSGAVVSFIVDNARQQVNSYTTTHNGQLDDIANTTDGTGATATLVAVTDGAAPSSSNNAYANMHLYVTSTRGLGEVYKISSYDAANKTITLADGAQWSDAIANPTAETSTEEVTYEILPIVTVESNGTRAVQLKPVLEYGRISRVKVIDGGENATYVKVTVHDNSGQNPDTTSAEIRAVLSPVKGLGADIEKDLGAYYVMLNARLSHNDESGDFPLSNDYRQLGIIRDVRNADGSIATDDTLNACKTLEVDTLVPAGLPAFQVDEVIKQTYTVAGIEKTARAKLIEFIDQGSGIYTIGFIQTPDTGFTPFSASSTEPLITERKDQSSGAVLGENEQTTCTIRSVIQPEIKKFDGEILYLENRRAVLRSPEQTEDIKAIIEF
jgi:hypothetical protein